MTRRPAKSIASSVELSICAALFGIGCFGPNPNYLGIGDYADDTGGLTSGAASETTEDDTGEETGSSDDMDSSETGSDSIPLAPLNPSCGDGNLDPGEFCYRFVELLDLTAVQSLAVADFDGDGFRDLAIGRKDDVLVLFGDGTGAFPRMADLPESNSNYFGAAAGDLDGDEIADLVFSQASNDAVLVYHSSSGGEFADPLSFATGDNPQRLALARLDRDPNLDLVVSIRNDDTVEVLLGDGAGGFGEPTAFASGGAQPIELGLGGFTPNSTADLVVGNFNDQNLAILLGTPAGQLELAHLQPLSGKPRSTVVADFDLDGHLDVAAALEDLDRVQVLYGDGLGGLLDSGVELPVGDRPMGAVAADFNLDDAPDLLVINRDDPSVGVSFGAPELPGQFMAQVLMDELSGFSGMNVVISADLNHDGVADVIIGGAGVRAMISNP